jgi:hypothetical protein
VVLLATPPAALSGQHDYRNLDAGRPSITEDAYPVEQWALELMLPVHHERHAGKNESAIEPEVMWGLAANSMIGLGLPITLGEGGGLAGLRPFAFRNFNTEGPRLPAFALRVDASVPVGRLGGDGPTATVTALATRSFGVTRAHLNVGATVGSTANAPLADPPARWSAGVAVDWTLWRTSTLVVAEVHAARPLDEPSMTWLAGAGIRRQITPSMVVDVGIRRRLTERGPDLVLTAGFTRSFSVAGRGFEGN